MKKEYRTELEQTNETKGLELADEMLEGVNGAGLHHRNRHMPDPKPDWTEIDPEDGSAGVTYTW